MSELNRTHDETQIEWIAHDIFRDIKDGEYRMLISPSFVFGTSTLCLKLAGRFRNDPLSTTLGVIILNRMNYLLRSNLPMLCTYGLKNPDGTVHRLGVRIMKTDEEESRHNFDKLFEVIQEKLQQWPSNVADITFTFKIEILHDYEPQPKRLRKEDILSQNFKDLFAIKLGYDTVIHVKDKEFHAHKAVLIARSRVFAAMFQHDTSEKQTGIITISDCDPDSFEEFLEYLYCGKLEELSSRNAYHLYETSEKYNVLELKMFCVELLLENMIDDTFCDIVSLADKYDDAKLISGAQNFFCKNSTNIVKTSEWDQLRINNSPLSDRLLSGLKEMTETKINKHCKG